MTTFQTFWTSSGIVLSDERHPGDVRVDRVLALLLRPQVGQEHVAVADRLGVLRRALEVRVPAWALRATIGGPLVTRPRASYSATMRRCSSDSWIVPPAHGLADPAVGELRDLAEVAAGAFVGGASGLAPARLEELHEVR
jgi:hypothetical protein